MAEAFGAIFICSFNGRTEDAAGHGTPGVDFAEAGGKIERGTGRVIGEIVEFFLVFWAGAEDAGFTIAGKSCAVLCEPGAGADFDGVRGCGVRCAECGHAGAEAGRVEGVDAEGAEAALRAAGAADEMRTGAEGGLGERRVDDLEEVGVARREHEGMILRQ